MVFNELGVAFLEILKAPFVDLSALWMLIPLLILWIVLTIYFGMHKKEVLGWNTSLGNGIAVFWITVELMRHLFKNSFEYFSFDKFFVVLLLLCYSMFICYISFKHTFTARTTYILSSPSVIYYFSGIVILWAYGSLHINKWVLIDIFLLFGFVMLITFLLKKLIPESKDSGRIIEREVNDILKAGPPDVNQEPEGNSF